MIIYFSHWLSFYWDKIKVSKYPDAETSSQNACSQITHQEKFN